MSGRGRSNKGSSAGGGHRGAKPGSKQVMSTGGAADPETSHVGRSCRVCRGEDDEEMVSCDKCLQWFHFSCVGVTQDIEDMSWSCVGCTNPNPVSGSNSNPDGTKETTLPVVPVLSNSNPNNAQTLKVSKVKSVVSHTSSRTSHVLAKLKLQKLEEERALNANKLEEERLLNAKKTEQERTYLEEKYKLLEELANETGSNLSSAGSAVREWVDGQQVSDFVPYAHSSRHSHQESQQRAGTISRTNHRSASDIAASVHHENPYHGYSAQREEDCGSLTSKQIAARHAISRDLPQFSGNPEEWPLFLATFNSTTAMCGFTNDENIFRLQRSLKGRAYEAVKSRLVHSSNVPGVLKILKMMFGQPEAIINSLIEKICALPPIREDKFETLVDFAVSVENYCATVDACGLEEYLYNVTLLHQLVNKLPPTMKLNWAQHRQSLPAVNLAAFSTWIYTIAEAASALMCPSNMSTKPTQSESRSTAKKGNFLNAHSVNPSANGSNDVCLVCKADCKTIDKCKRFLELSRDSRWAIVREFSLCRRCLCRHDGMCQAKVCGKNGCQYKHHALLHNDQRQHSLATEGTSKSSTSISSENTNEFPEPNSTVTHGCHTHRTKTSDTLFRYLPVMLHGERRSVRTYAFLDDGSALTLLDEELADELELEGEIKPLCLHWTSGTQRHETNSRIVELQIAGIHSGAKSYTINGARTVNELMLPFQTMDIKELSQVNPYLQGLPIASYQGVRPRILIGLKDLHLSMILNCREGKPSQPIAVKTRLGWTVCGGGSTDLASSPVHSVYHISNCDLDKTDEDLHKAMKDYFSLDSLGITKPHKVLLSVEDQTALSLQQSLTRFTGQRYETGLLWRSYNLRLPDSQAMALHRFQCLEKRMVKDKALAETLTQKIADHLSKGYIRKLTENELQQSYQRTWYLPVFPVTNPNKPGKVRMVWDAAAKVHGVSLNSALLKGPDLLSSLYTVLIRFRESPIVLTGDIREMFHQVMIRELDQQCQRFYWRDENGQLAVFVMRVMTFGACCSPSCAQYVMNMNAERFAQIYPAATEVIKKQHYVDDMLVSVDTEEKAIKLAQDVAFVHSQGGFEIRNWASNSQSVLKALQENNTTDKNLDLSPEIATEKVLGMWWCTEADVFTFKVGWDRYDRDLLEGHRRPTKREVLRVLMTIFDPLGLIAPFLVYLKILLQEVWRSGIQWDDKVDDNILTKWRIWLRGLPQVEQVQIPRCLRSNFTRDYEHVQLHTFVDASENAMAAACYLRFVQNGVVRSSLVAAKTRVAPLRYHTIPRLECQSAVIGVRLARSIVDSLSFPVDKLFYHTDSRDVICWLNSDHRRYSPFIASRVSEILEATEVNQWRWVPTKLNVADDATKWEKSPDMTPSSRWYNGPEFLWLPEEAWPHQLVKGSKTDTELRPSLLVHLIKPDTSIKVSSWKRMINVAIVVHRFPANCRLRNQNRPIVCGPPTSEELLVAERYVIRQAQREAYPDEVSILLKPSGVSNSSVLKASSLYKLSPWLDEHGLMRMRGRISACALATEDAKNPIILPRNHHTTTLIIAHYHNKYHHQNHETVMNELRQRFRIPRLRTAYAKVRKDCQRCKNNSSIPQPPTMADLPYERLDVFARPFTHAGIDYFGPLEVVVGRRVEKRWGMLVTCMTTRAIHIEIVHTLNTDSCIMGLRNFAARRGTPRTINSDRGTCFIGANRELQEAAKQVNMEDVMKEFNSAETSWKFNPPLSPHMGGSWERLIGVVKRNLMSICPSRKPNDEILRNLLTEIENTVNSRQLTHVPVDDESAPALTPNHFLLGSSDGTKPLCTFNDSGDVLRRTWRTSQVLANQFWKRWLSDYLPEITRRTKWYVDTKPIEGGDVVVIADPNLPRNCWPKGKIIGTNISKDGKIRAATVKTANGVYERPVVKLAVLDVRRDQL
ncbi:uncharacterized protein LOC131687869 [Topomyia yanbarensis]|uniref:uncharacterized protein LOC131687869 n=1 Tax=Topomyia yanbarensis TaxID=2498891 RepID=UPI00273AF11F|nr:uncharacterized protein LOC131687869 [Topomyia yanbarensis]